MPMNQNNESALSYLRELAEKEFWGTIEFKFQHGQIIHVAKLESLKPEQLIPEYRRNYGSSK